MVSAPRAGYADARSARRSRGPRPHTRCSATASIPLRSPPGAPPRAAADNTGRTPGHCHMGSHLSSTQITVSPIPLLTPVKYRRGMFLADVLPDAPTTTDDALALFDASAAADTEFMIGTWHGAELPTGHPLDGLLEASGWWGKQFVD